MRNFPAFRRHRVAIAGASFAAAGFAAGIFAAPNSQAIVTSIEQAAFVPLDAARPELAQMAVLRGDPAVGASSMLLKFGKMAGRMHVHSSDYDLVVIKGEMKHWGAGQSAAEAKLLVPGSYWFQPGNQAHADSCLSEECLMYVQWSGKRDTRIAQ